MAKQTTLAEDVQHVHDTVQAYMAANGPEAKIDWTNVRKLIAQLLEKWGPVFLPIIIGWLTPKDPTT
jgi:ElaB/YqjD/DUF883 family membrane-anchored ribosome-binding protein